MCVCVGVCVYVCVCGGALWIRFISAQRADSVLRHLREKKSYVNWMDPHMIDDCMQSQKVLPGVSLALRSLTHPSGASSSWLLVMQDRGQPPPRGRNLSDSAAWQPGLTSAFCETYE